MNDFWKLWGGGGTLRKGVTPQSVARKPAASNCARGIAVLKQIESGLHHKYDMLWYSWMGVDFRMSLNVFFLPVWCICAARWILKSNYGRPHLNYGPVWPLGFPGDSLVRPLRAQVHVTQGVGRSICSPCLLSHMLERSTSWVSMGPCLNARKSGNMH